MKAELALWRFGVGLLGSRWVTAPIVAVMTLSYAVLAFVLLHPLRLLRSVQPLLDITALLAAPLFLSLAFAPAALRRAWRNRPLLQLAPDAKRMTSSLAHRLYLIALIAMIPAIILRALLWSKLGTDIYATIALSDISLQSYGLVTLYLSHVVILMAVTFGPLKVPAQFASLPIMYGAMSWHGTFWLWMPLLVCVFMVGVTWFRRWWLTDEKTRSRWPQPFAMWSRQRTPWWTALLQRRAARATGANGVSVRVVGLLASRSSVFVTVATVLALVIYMAIAPGTFAISGLKWFLVYMMSAVVAQLSPIPLSRIILVPLGAERRRMGQIIALVWAHDLRIRIALGVSLGLVVHAFCWWMQWPAFLRSPFHATGDAWTQLLWRPLAHAVGLYGIAMSACLIASASPKLLESASFGPLLPITTTLAFAVAGGTVKWILNELIPATASPDSDDITFAIVNGALLPALAWCVHRALRYQWATANLSAISSAMQTWSARWQKVFSPG